MSANSYAGSSELSLVARPGQGRRARGRGRRQPRRRAGGGLVARVRSAAAEHGTVSTVDDADDAFGQVSAVLALAGRRWPAAWATTVRGRAPTPCSRRRRSRDAWISRPRRRPSPHWPRSSATGSAEVSDAIAPLWTRRDEGTEVLPAAGRDAPAVRRPPPAQLAMVIVGAAAPFASTSYSRARLIRQMHASGLLSADEVRRTSAVLGPAAPTRSTARRADDARRGADSVLAWTSVDRAPAAANWVTKHLFVTGGVASSLGKGLTASSLGSLLKARGLRVDHAEARPLPQRRPGDDEPVPARRGVRHRGRRRDRPGHRSLRALPRHRPGRLGERHDRPGLLDGHRQGAARRVPRRHRPGHPAHHQRDQGPDPGDGGAGRRTGWSRTW